MRHTLSTRARAGLTLVLTVLLTVTIAVVITPAAAASPPRIPTKSTAKYELPKLVVKNECLSPVISTGLQCVARSFALTCLAIRTASSHGCIRLRPLLLRAHEVAFLRAGARGCGAS